MRQHRMWAVVVAGVVALNACGSTRQTGALPESGFDGKVQERVDGPANDAVRSSPDVASTSGRGAVAGRGSQVGEVATASAPGTGGDGTPAGGAGGGPTGTLQVGIATFDIDALVAVGNAISGTDRQNDSGISNSKDIADAVIESMNAHGGIAGRQIEPIYYDYPLANIVSPEGRRRAEQEMCAHWTEDNHVFAMVPVVANEAIVLECAVHSDTAYIAISPAEEGVDELRFNDVGRWWYRPNWLTAERRERTIAARLVTQGFFGEGAKVGILVDDKPVYRRGVTNTLRPALAEAAVEVVAEIAYPDLLESPWDSYVLQFQTAGVTHVLFSHAGASGTPVWMFMSAAENQLYRPAYGLASDQDLRVQTGRAPEEQLRRARGIGWSPPWDRPDQFFREPPMNPSDALCRRLMTDAGYPVSAGAGYCEPLFFLEAALDEAGEVSVGSLAVATEGLGNRYVPVMTRAATFGPRKHDGAATVYDLAYDIDCPCFIYTGGPHAVIG